jgi:hypothetical protein
MTQTQADIEQITEWLKLLRPGLIALTAIALSSLWIMPADDWFGLLRPAWRLMWFSVWGGTFLTGLYAGFDWVYRGSLSEQIKKGNPSAAAVACMVLLCGTLILYVK